MQYLFLKHSSLLPGIDQTNWGYSDDQGRSTLIVNFMTLGERILMLEHAHASHIVKLHDFLKDLLRYTQA